MGGAGSGRRWHWGAKDLTSSYIRLDVRRWARDGLIEPGRNFAWQWTCDGERTADIQVSIGYAQARLKYRVRSFVEEWEEMEYAVQFLQQPCHFGGYRTWFACPARGCGRRVAILYGGRIFACRNCYQLSYPSQREEPFQRASRRADKVRVRLSWEEGEFAGPKPKGMHRATFRRLTQELDYWENVCDASFLERYGRLLGDGF